MKPITTKVTNDTFALAGAGPEADLPVERTTEDRQPVINSVWEPSAEERARIAAGENVELSVWGQGHPPVAVSVTPLSAIA